MKRQFFVALLIILSLYLGDKFFFARPELLVNVDDVFVFTTNDHYIKNKLVERSNFSLHPENILITDRNNKLTLVVLGESTAAGFPFMFHQAWPGVLNKILEKILNIRCEIVNLASAAFTSYSVRDLSRKVLELKPDIVLIYTGHNEYYGTITAKNIIEHNLNLFYLWAYENIGIYRFLVDFFLSQKIIDKSKSLMHNQFSNYLINNDFDDNVSIFYKDNLYETIKVFLENQIKVVLIRPVSNLVDQPPFRLMVENSNELLEHWKVVLSQRNNDSLEFLLDLLDKDLVPFRMRKAISQSLDELNEIYEKNSNFLFVDLFDELNQKLSLEAFSSYLFIDHVHFNRLGQYVVGHIVANRILEKFYTRNISQLIPLSENFRQEIELSINVNPFLELIALSKIIELINQEPFVSMSIKSNYNLQSWINLNLSKANDMFLQNIKYLNLESFLNVLNNFAFLENNHQIENLYDSYYSLFYCYPASETIIENFLIIQNKIQNFKLVNDLEYRLEAIKSARFYLKINNKN